MSDIDSMANDSPKADSDGRESPSRAESRPSGHTESDRLGAEVKTSEEADATVAEGSQAPDEQTAETSQMQHELEAVQAELQDARRQATEYLEGWQRARAEFANYRRRVEGEREELRQASNRALLLKLLPVVDDFERAFQTMPEELAEMPWVNGIRMIFRKLQALLESENVSPIEATGQHFDPVWHEAVMQEETTEYPDEHVIEEMQRGYRLGQRVLRPSMVKVASNPGQPGNQKETE
jgi:molecular chaperone GrpE